ncbi:MAG: hypothetical protein HFF38_12960 [Lawsonibacter sp.]|nr:hypothetical protein [Lawsonibacter sp.]
MIWQRQRQPRQWASRLGRESCTAGKRQKIRRRKEKQELRKNRGRKIPGGLKLLTVPGKMPVISKKAGMGRKETEKRTVPVKSVGKVPSMVPLRGI